MHALPLYLVANERPLINVDVTLLINIGLWILLFIVLRPLLWDPMIKLISAREAGMGGSRDKARELEADAKLKKAEYEAAMKRARATASDAREKLRNDAKKKESEIVAQARQQTQAALESQRAQLASQRGQLTTEMNALVPQLASDIASKVLGREVRS
jgi:F-type H+-transporting ATPase subunit b